MNRFIIRFRGTDGNFYDPKLRVGYYARRGRGHYYSSITSDPGWANTYRDKAIATRTVTRLTKEVKGNKWRGATLKPYKDGSYFKVVQLEPLLHTVYSVDTDMICPDTKFSKEDVELVHVTETKHSKEWLSNREGYYTRKQDAYRVAARTKKRVLKYLVDLTVAFEHSLKNKPSKRRAVTKR